MTSKREDREALITEAAEAIVEAMGGIVPDELESMHADAAKAALAVFEQAHTPTTPTDDEPSIEEVAEAFQQHEGAPTWKDDPVGRDAALRWHMRGFKDGLNARRPVQGEPSLSSLSLTHSHSSSVSVSDESDESEPSEAPKPSAYRFDGESDPIATNPILRGVDLAFDRLVRRDCFTERTMRILDELRAEVLAFTTQEGGSR